MNYITHHYITYISQKWWIIMMTSSNGNIFRVTGHLSEEFTGPRWIPRTKASNTELWCFLDQRLNKRLSKQSWGWCFEMLSRPLWRHCNDASQYEPRLTLAVPALRNNLVFLAAISIGTVWAILWTARIYALVNMATIGSGSVPSHCSTKNWGTTNGNET